MPKRKKSRARQAPDVKDYALAYLEKIKSFRITRMVIDSFKLITESWGMLCLAALVDFVFLVVFSLIATTLQTRAFDHLYQLLMLVGTQTGGLIKEIQNPFSTKLSDLMQNPAFSFHLQQVLFHLLLMFVALLIFWCIFEGISWWISHKIKSKHEKAGLKLTDYLGRFIVSSVFFFIITMGLIAYFLQKYIEVGISIETFLTQGTVLFIYTAALLIVWYFGFLSYASLSGGPFWNVKQSIVLGVKKIWRMIPTILFLVVFYYIVLELWTLLLSLTNNYVAFVYGLVIFMPSITFARVLFIKAAALLQKP
ncbi:hypothetical protein ACFL96_13845 [Thermoproteota archaeon]